MVSLPENNPVCTIVEPHVLNRVSKTQHNLQEHQKQPPFLASHFALFFKRHCCAMLSGTRLSSPSLLEEDPVWISETEICGTVFSVSKGKENPEKPKKKSNWSSFSFLKMFHFLSKRFQFESNWWDFLNWRVLAGIADRGVLSCCGVLWGGKKKKFEILRRIHFTLGKFVCLSHNSAGCSTVNVQRQRQLRTKLQQEIAQV